MWCRNYFLIVSSIILSVIAITAAKNVQFKTVKTTQGLVKGYMSDGVYTFYGIPYASAPKGASKFMNPLPGPIWIDTFEAVDKTIVCPQVIAPEHNVFIAPFSVNVTEDCLVANVFVPDTEEKRLPVVVLVHGGGYQGGFGNALTPLSVVKEGNIIYVSANYRLSLYGFLCLGTEDAPGNAGVKDVLTLLKWVKRNIASFGGNPEDVTLTGYSAGSSMITLLMMSKAANGLYNKVILESGSVYSTWGVVMDPIEAAAGFAKNEGLDTKDVNELKEFYSNLPIEKLRMDTTGKLDSSFYFAPCVEQKTMKGAVLTDAPFNLLKNGAVNKVPVLISITDLEGFIHNPKFEVWIEMMNKNFTDFLPADLKFETPEEKETLARKVKKFYLGEEQAGTNNLQGYFDFFSDTMFGYPTHRTVRELVKGGNEEVYLYYYTHHEPNVRGADHCDQTRAIYNDVPFSSDESQITDSRKQIKKIIREIWLNFVKIGKPVPSASSEYPAGWPPVSGAASPYMEVSLTPRLRQDLLEERFAFWDQIYENHLRVPVPPPRLPTHTEL